MPGAIPPTPTATLAGSKYVYSAVTATRVDANYQPVNPTSQFKVNQPVYVIVRVRNAPAGPHTLTIRWFLNGTRLQPAQSAATSVVVNAPNSTVSFSYSYPSAGTGTARVYWDLPPDTSDMQAGAWLAQNVAFVIA